MIKKICILLLLVFLVTTSCYAVSLADTIFCKKVYLKLVKRMVLVHRISEEVKYILTNEGKWVILKGPLRHQYQSIYEAQLRRQ